MKHLSLTFSFLTFYTLLLLGQPLTGITYSVGEGLPQSQVFAMTQDANGYLWFGTQGGGLGRFDGKRFQPFLPSEYVLAIGETTDKTLWIGTTKGAFRWQVKQFEPVQTADNQLHSITSFTTTEKETLLVGSEKGLWLWDEKSKQLQKKGFQRELDKAYIQSFFKDEKGIWVASNRGAFCLKKDGSVLIVSAVAGLLVQSINKDTAGNYWFITYNQGIFILKNNDLQIIPRRCPKKSRSYGVARTNELNVTVGLPQTQR